MRDGGSNPLNATANLNRPIGLSVHNHSKGMKMQVIKKNKIPKSNYTNVGVYVGLELRQRMRNFPDVNWSANAAKLFLEICDGLEKEQAKNSGK